MTTFQQQANEWLQAALGAGAHFRDGQWEAIAALVEQRQRVLVVQRTGWGKSLVYFMATRLLRTQGAGPTILISPLLSLMRNQIASAAQYGLRAATVNSSNPDDHSQIEAALLTGKLDLLLISPERLANDRFQRDVWTTLRQQVGLLVVDEAHCISDWGHDFRPNYRRIMELLDEIPPDTPVIGTTATANDRVVADVAAILGAGINIQRGPLTRDSLSLYVYPEAMDASERLTLLSYLLKHLPGSGIIYCTTTRDCQQVAEWLQSEGIRAKAYFADVEETQSEDRAALEDQLMRNEVKALVSSVALGMGFDKSDLHFVIHYQLPGNIISYYQQIGRAGRGIDRAHIILMYGAGDEDIQRYFIDTAFPQPQQVQEVIQALAQRAQGRTDLQQRVNVRVSTLDKILTHLEVEQIIEKRDGDYILVKTDAAPDYARWSEVTRTRYAELAHMKAYLRERGCLMHFLAKALDDPHPVERCGRCKNCTGAQSKFQPLASDIQRAQLFLRRGNPLRFEPRRRWPGRSAEFPKTTDIHINQTGVALCGYYDEGWGVQVRAGRDAGHYSDELVEAAAAVLRAYWKQTGVQVNGVVPMPSLRRPLLVPSFAERLAKTLGLPYAAVIQHENQHPPQTEMRNSFQQATNVRGNFTISTQLKGKPILLVDDIADSKWTLTVIGNLLQRHGSGPVHPFVLALTNTGE
ncbi:MAG: RecQ family ATP-dependent DNA helicase [Chloroflexota bacterium]|nr:RecQ family ATP-dependent DNA helicase [Chloroflexota bacterium]